MCNLPFGELAVGLIEHVIVVVDLLQHLLDLLLPLLERDGLLGLALPCRGRRVHPRDAHPLLNELPKAVGEHLRDLIVFYVHCFLICSNESII